MKLFLDAVLKGLLGFALMGLMLFAPAGTLDYPGAWRFLGLLFVPMMILAIVLAAKDPDMLRKRLNMKEKRASQQKVVGLSGLLMVLCFPVSGLDFRFGWSSLPDWVGVVSGLVLLVSYGLYAEVMRENAWLSRTVEVQEGQQVVDTGLYGLVRHPMYFATSLLFLSIPLVLGSLPGLVCMLPYPALMAARIKDEEALLVRELAGYESYRRKVKWRMLPFIW